MRSTAARLTAGAVLALILLAALASSIVPTLDAGLAGAVSLCAPDAPATADQAASRGRASLQDRSPAILLVPRCGVA